MKKLLGYFFFSVALFFLFPAVMGIFHIGMLWPAILAVLLGLHFLFPQWCRFFPKWIVSLVRIGLAIFLVYASTLFILMGVCSNNCSGEKDATVVILGCQVYNEKPSAMLQSRIDVAYEYLTQHPQSVCIATGGMDDNETITEAECIKDALVSMGISQERIYMEDHSRSTYENIYNASTIISDYQLNSNIQLATDRFHEYRAHFFAKEQSLIPYSLSCHSIWFLAPGYWCREVIAITAMWVRGY